MNITMNSPTLPASSDAATVTGAAPADGLPLDPALAAAQPGAPAPLAFLQFMQMDAVVPGEALPQPELAGEAAANPQAAAPAGAEAQDESSETAAEPLTAAMSLPLTPAMMMAMPATLPAAVPAAVRFAAGTPERQPRAADAVAATGGAQGVELPAAAQRGAEATIAAVLPQAAQPAPETSVQQARASAAVAQPSAAPQQPAAASSAAPARESGADGQAGSGSATGANAAFGVSAPAVQNAAPRDGGSLTLSGPPTAWRQSLQDALGERLNLQLGKNAEQAVIRLEPPMLGRVEISIRHAAGSLEVNITATHSEVLRQLNTVSDNLRSDLAQRQYTDVAVNVSQATPRAQATAQSGAGFGADAQGRGRQQGQDQDERAPGAALAEANQSSSPFSLNGRA